MYRVYLPFLLALLGSCVSEPDQQPSTAPQEQQLKRQFLEANVRLLQKENDDMDQYARNHGIPFRQLASGVRLHVYNHAAKGDSIRPGMLIAMDYTVSLLDGTVCYTSADTGPKTITVEQESIESGVQRGVQHLKTGDQALLMVPSALAHGLLGDMNKIPPQTPVLYNIQVH